ncbi:MAG: DoxX family protein [Gemmatimonadaceae bacterium]
MSLIDAGPSSAAGKMLSVLRIVVGALFMEHGTQKLFNVPPAAMPGFPVHLMSQFGLAGVLETFGGALILIGLLTRPVAFLLAGEMAVAYFQQHFPRSSFPIFNMGEPAVLFCFTYLYLMVAGGGEWSVDTMIANSRRGGRT